MRRRASAGASGTSRSLLTSHENAHIAFTLSVQAVMGAFLIYLWVCLVWAGRASFRRVFFIPLMVSLLTLLTYGLVRLNLHLGKPMRFYRGFNNWRLSPVSREIFGVSLFFAGLGRDGLFRTIGMHVLAMFDAAGLALLAMNLASIVALLGLVVGLYYMIKLYLIPARPFWNHWQTASSFTGTMFSMGTIFFSLILVASLGGNIFASWLPLMAGIALFGLALEAVGLLAHAQKMHAQGGEGAVSHFEQVTRYGKSYLLRNVLLGLNIAALIAITLFGLPNGGLGIVLGSVLALN